MYAGSKLELEKRAEVHKVYELCDLDDLCLDWLKEKLAKWKTKSFQGPLNFACGQKKEERKEIVHEFLTFSYFKCGKPKYKLPSTAPWSKKFCVRFASSYWA